jgi:hypothetical protein
MMQLLFLHGYRAASSAHVQAALLMPVLLTLLLPLLLLLLLWQ